MQWRRAQLPPLCFSLKLQHKVKLALLECKSAKCEKNIVAMSSMSCISHFLSCSCRARRRVQLLRERGGGWRLFSFSLSPLTNRRRTTRHTHTDANSALLSDDDFSCLLEPPPRCVYANCFNSASGPRSVFAVCSLKSGGLWAADSRTAPRGRQVVLERFEIYANCSRPRRKKSICHWVAGLF